MSIERSSRRNGGEGCGDGGWQRDDHAVSAANPISHNEIRRQYRSYRNVRSVRKGAGPWPWTSGHGCKQSFQRQAEWKRLAKRKSPSGAVNERFFRMKAFQLISNNTLSRSNNASP